MLLSLLYALLARRVADYLNNISLVLLMFLNKKFCPLHMGVVRVVTKWYEVPGRKRSLNTGL
jgi:hypothetical protein